MYQRTKVIRTLTMQMRLARTSGPTFTGCCRAFLRPRSWPPSVGNSQYRQITQASRATPRPYFNAITRPVLNAGERTTLKITSQQLASIRLFTIFPYVAVGENYTRRPGNHFVPNRRRKNRTAFCSVGTLLSRKVLRFFRADRAVVREKQHSRLVLGAYFPYSLPA